MSESRTPATVRIDAFWDPEASVWVATSSDVRGFVTEAATIEELRRKSPLILADLAEEYGSDLDGVEIVYVAEARDRFTAAA